MNEAEAHETAPAAPGAVAWDLPETVARWKRSARRTAAVVAVGLALGALFAAYIGRLTDHTADLWERGIPSGGMVMADPKNTIRCSQVPVPVRFSVRGDVVVHPYYVDSCGSGLREGDLVRVRYNPDDPSDFLVNGESSEEPGPTLLAIVALVGSTFALAGGAAKAVGLVRRRAILRRHPWTTRPAVVAPFPSPWVRGFAAIELGDPERPRLLISGSLPASPDRVGSPTELRVAGGEQGSVVVEAAKGFGLAHPPRRRGSRRRAARSIERWAASSSGPPPPSPGA